MSVDRLRTAATPKMTHDLRKFLRRIFSFPPLFLSRVVSAGDVREDIIGRLMDARKFLSVRLKDSRSSVHFNPAFVNPSISSADPGTVLDASSEPGCSRDQKQPCPDNDGPDGSRDALTGRCETLDGDGCRHYSHRAKIHDADDQEDRHQTGTAVAAVEAEAQAVSQGRAGVGRQRTAAPG